LLLINHTILVRFPILIVPVVITIIIFIAVMFSYILATSTQSDRLTLALRDTIHRFPVGLVIVVVVVPTVIVVVVVSVATTAALSDLFLLVHHDIIVQVPLEVVGAE
jgi:hypothetical protein